MNRVSQNKIQIDVQCNDNGNNEDYNDYVEDNITITTATKFSP